MVQLLNDERGEVGFGAPGGANTGGGAGGGAGAGGSGGAAGGGGGEPGSNAGGGKPAGTEISYPSDLNKDFHGNATLMKFYNEDKKEFNMGALMQSHVHLQGMMGTDKVNIPTKDSTDADWRAVKHKLGLPDSVEKYELTNNMPEGLSANEAFLNEFKAHAFEQGILPKDAQSVMDFYNSTIGKHVSEDSQKATDKLNTDWQNLKNEWGGNYDQNLQVTNEALTQFATPQQMEQLKSEGLLNNPLLVKIFQNIGANMGEDSFSQEFRSKATMSVTEVDSEIKKIWGNPAFRNKLLPGHQGLQDKYMDLHRMKGRLKKDTESRQGGIFR